MCLRQQPRWNCLPRSAWKGHIHLAIAPTKMMERIEWMAEKATEIGFDELSFLNCQFSERKVVKTPRIDKIVISAVKQSHKAWKPVVNELESFKEFIQTPRPGRKFICHCYEEIEKKDFFQEISSFSDSAEGNDASSADITVLVTRAYRWEPADFARKRRVWWRFTWRISQEDYNKDDIRKNT